MHKKWDENAENKGRRNAYAPLVNAGRSSAKYRNIAKLKYWSSAVAREDGNHGGEKQRANSISNGTTSNRDIVEWARQATREEI